LYYNGRQGIAFRPRTSNPSGTILVNHRLSKKQQMRWSPAGPHYLLQVRVEVLNGTLADAYRVANLRFRGSSGFRVRLTDG
jgi:hypothetical protein